MSREKQIEEMAKAMCAYHGTEKCYECRYCCDCHIKKNAERLYNAGYRKAHDVAREIFAAVDATIDLVSVMTGFDITIFGKYAELKKKYESEKDNDNT